MGKKGRRHTGRRSACRAVGLLRLWGNPRNAIILFATVVLLFNAAVPYWHAAQRAQAWALALAEPAAKHHATLAGGVDCPLHNNGTGGQEGGDEAPLGKKPCPLCQALQLFSPGLAQPGFIVVPCAPPAVAAFVPHRLELKSGRETAEQGRPRAPPLA